MNINTQDIITPRLLLRLMTEEFLIAGLNEDVQQAESLIDLKISQDWFDEKDIMRLRLDDYREDFEYIPWGLRAVSLKDSKEMIGFIGFHSSPDPDYLQSIAPKAIEYGYTIFVPYRRVGFAQEAIIGLMNWAITQYPIENFLASVSPINIASTELVKKLNFVKVSEQIDETDGLEFVYALHVEKLKLDIAKNLM